MGSTPVVYLLDLISILKSPSVSLQMPRAQGNKAGVTQVCGNKNKLRIQSDPVYPDISVHARLGVHGWKPGLTPAALTGITCKARVSSHSQARLGESDHSGSKRQQVWNQGKQWRPCYSVWSTGQQITITWELVRNAESWADTSPIESLSAFF